MYGETPFPTSESAIWKIVHNASSIANIVVWFKLILQFCGQLRKPIVKYLCELGLEFLN